MAALLHQRCFNHAGREAVARCPECRQYFCRECITEHDDRVLCSACLKKTAAATTPAHFTWAKLSRLGQWVMGIGLAWFFFFLIGEGLLKLPSTFHEGTLWQSHEVDAE